MSSEKPFELEFVRIVGLYGRHTYSIPFDQKLLVLVGENGSGKSTVVSIIFYFLTRQWFRLAEFDFELIEVGLDGERLALTKKELESYCRADRDRHYPRSIYRSVVALYDEAIANRSMYPLDLGSGFSDVGLSRDELSRLISKIVERFRLPPNVARRMIDDIIGERDGDGTTVEKIEKFFSSRYRTPVLFLPTYRRIERDLKAIFPDLEKHIEDFRQTHSRRNDAREYIELVEFGMHDVEAAFRRTTEALKESLRMALDALTGDYLRDALRRRYESADISLIQGLEDSTLESILARIDEKFLPNNDKEQLRERIDSIRKADRIQYHDQVVAHFFGKLIALHRQQAEKESRVRSFVDVCNKYLENKKVFFDNGNFSIGIAPVDESGNVCGALLEPQMLSSGEKQIVSLFTHLFMSPNDGFFVVIDEPELSLSVPWQERFLPDIWSSGRCKGLLAVTHSPFIYTNEELRSSTFALVEFREE